MSSVVDRPSPVPKPGGLVVKNGSKIRARVAASMPAPVSVTESTNARVDGIGAGGDRDLATRRASRRARSTTRLSTACSMRLGSATIVAGLAARSSSSVTADTEHLVEQLLHVVETRVHVERLGFVDADG